MGILQARILEWVVMPSSRASSQARDWTQVSCTAGRFFTDWAPRETQNIHLISIPIDIWSLNNLTGWLSDSRLADWENCRNGRTEGSEQCLPREACWWLGSLPPTCYQPKYTLPSYLNLCLLILLIYWPLIFNKVWAQLTWQPNIFWDTEYVSCFIFLTMYNTVKVWGGSVSCQERKYQRNVWGNHYNYSKEGPHCLPYVGESQYKYVI